MALRNDGLALLNARISMLPEGRMPAEMPVGFLQYLRPGHQKWAVTRHTPKGQAWGASTHTSASVRHIVRYQLVARHVSGLKVQTTVWSCARRAFSIITVDETQLPAKKCWMCTKNEKP